MDVGQLSRGRCLGRRAIRQFVRRSAEWAEHRIQLLLVPTKTCISLIVMLSAGSGERINLRQVSSNAQHY